MADTTTPRGSTPEPTAEEHHESTVLELEQKLRDLEFRFLGKETPGVLSSPFTPLPSLEKRIEQFRSKLESTAANSVTAKLPPVPLPVFDGTDLELFLKEFERWLRLSGIQSSPESYQVDWLIQCSTAKIRRIVEKVVEENPKLDAVLLALSQLFPRLENDLTLREALEKLAPLPHSPDPSQVKRLLVEFEELQAKMSKGALGEQEKFLLLSRKVHPRTFQELRLDRYYKRRTENYDELKACLLEKSQEDWLERHLQKKVSLQTLQEVPQVAPAQEESSQVSSSQGHGRGKGKGKGKGKGGFGGKGGKGGFGEKGKGKGKGFPSDQPSPHFSVTVFCKYCGKKGHYQDQCWTKQKAERKAKAASGGQSGATPSTSGGPNASPSTFTSTSDKKRKFESTFFKEPLSPPTSPSSGRVSRPSSTPVPPRVPSPKGVSPRRPS